jgi:hypothetical protein
MDTDGNFTSVTIERRTVISVLKFKLQQNNVETESGKGGKMRDARRNFDHGATSPRVDVFYLGTE